jgi:hypothetical protein
MEALFVTIYNAYVNLQFCILKFSLVFMFVWFASDNTMKRIVLHGGCHSLLDFHILQKSFRGCIFNKTWAMNT